MSYLVSVVIPNYNGEEILGKNLPKVFEVVGDVEIIVVDDASVDGSLKVLDSFKSKIKVIKNEKNLGFSSTVNRGVKEAQGEIVILLNTDVVPEKDFLVPLLRHFTDEKVFAVGCMDKSVENGKIILRGRGIGKWEKGFLAHSRGEVNKTNTLWVSGGSGAFRKSIWNVLEGFNELYNPFYWEDIDISYRAQKAGYKVIFEPKSIVVHEHEKGAIKRKFSPFQIKTIAYRNQFIFVWSNVTDIFILLSHVFWLPYHICFMLFRKEFIFFKGFIAACGLLPQVIRLRNAKARQYIETDYEVTKIFLIEFK